MDKLASDPPVIPLPPLLGMVARVGVNELHAALAEQGFEGIGPAHGCVFRFIDVDHGSRLTELAQRAALTKQSVGEVADQLQQLGYVERVPDPDDRRAKLIRLTDRGRQAHAAARHILSDIERRWGQRHGDERIATLRTVLEDILLEEPSAARVLHLA